MNNKIKTNERIGETKNSFDDKQYLLKGSNKGLMN
jgi:hypothetical protein